MNDSLSTEGVLRPMLRLAMPVLTEQLLNMLVGLVDTWLAGQYLDESHLAAIGLMSYVMWMLPSMFAAVAIGATALTARFVGAGDREAAARITHQALLLGTIASIVATTVAFWGHVPFVHAMRLEGEAVPLAVHYSRFLLPVIPAIMIQQVGVACLHGAGDTVTGLWVMTAVNAINIAVGAGLVIGIGPLPQLGWTGLAIGTAVAHVCGAVLILAALCWGRGGLQLRWALFCPEWHLMRRILRIGIPGGLDVTAVLFCHLWYVSIINSLGTIEAAAHGLGIRIESLSYLPGTAFHVAAATLAGQALGAGDRSRATRAVWMSLLVGGSLMVAAGALFFFGSTWLTRLFLGERSQEVALLTVPLLRIVALSAPAQAMLTILSGGLRGAGDTRWPLLITFVGLLVVRIPLAYWFAHSSIVLPGPLGEIPGLGLGVIGAWWAMVVDVGLRGLLTLHRFMRGKWREIPV